MLMQKDSESTQTGSAKKLSLVLLLGGCFLMLVVILAWFALGKVQEKIRCRAGGS